MFELITSQQIAAIQHQFGDLPDFEGMTPDMRVRVVDYNPQAGYLRLDTGIDMANTNAFIGLMFDKPDDYEDPFGGGGISEYFLTDPKNKTWINRTRTYLLHEEVGMQLGIIDITHKEADRTTTYNLTLDEDEEPRELRIGIQRHSDPAAEEDGFTGTNVILTPDKRQIYLASELKGLGIDNLFKFVHETHPDLEIEEASKTALAYCGTRFDMHARDNIYVYVESRQVEYNHTYGEAGTPFVYGVETIGGHIRATRKNTVTGRTTTFTMFDNYYLDTFHRTALSEGEAWRSVLEEFPVELTHFFI